MLLLSFSSASRAPGSFAFKGCIKEFSIFPKKKEKAMKMGNVFYWE